MEFEITELKLSIRDQMPFKQCGLFWVVHFFELDLTMFECTIDFNIDLVGKHHTWNKIFELSISSN